MYNNKLLNMKKMFFAACAAAIALFACTPTAKEFKLSGAGFPETFNGTYAKVFDIDEKVIDSVLIENGVFEYKAPANDTVICMMMFGQTPMIFSHEAGDYTITYSTDESTNETILRRGGDANSSFMKVQEMQDKISELSNTVNKEAEELNALIGENEPSDKQLAQMNSIREKYFKESKEIYKSYYTEGSNTLIDWYAFAYLSQSMEPSEFVKSYDAAGSLIKNDKQMSEMYPSMLAAAKTGVGQQFVDYEMTNPAGETKKLSDFRVEGKYFLLDFFASWCGPCKVSMPIIAEVEKEFAKTLTSASIAVWESDSDGANYAQAVKDLKITWSTFQDAKSAGAELYGVIGVPTFILFSPEGEILVRGHDIKAVQNKLRELNK